MTSAKQGFLFEAFVKTVIEMSAGSMGKSLSTKEWNFEFRFPKQRQERREGLCEAVKEEKREEMALEKKTSNKGYNLCFRLNRNNCYDICLRLGLGSVFLKSL